MEPKDEKELQNQEEEAEETAETPEAEQAESGEEKPVPQNKVDKALLRAIELSGDPKMAMARMATMEKTEQAFNAYMRISAKFGHDGHKSCLPVTFTALGVLIAIVVLLSVGANNLAHRNDPVLKSRSLDYTMSQSEFSYYYWNEYFYALGNGAEAPDLNKSLKRQSYDGDQSWAEYLADAALQTAEETKALVFAAEAADYTMPEESRARMEQTIAGLGQQALEAGYVLTDGSGDVDSYLKASYGANAAMFSFQTYLEDSCLAAAYSDELYDGITCTAEEVEAHYDANAAAYAAEGVEKDGTMPVTVRMIFVAPASESEDDWSKAQATELAIYNQWVDAGSTETAFADLAETYSSRAGYYENLAPGQLTAAADAWCFDAARAAGDCAMVRGEDGYYILYFVSAGSRPLWYVQAERDLHYASYDQTLQELVDSCGFKEKTKRFHPEPPPAEAV